MRIKNRIEKLEQYRPSTDTGGGRKRLAKFFDERMSRLATNDMTDEQLATASPADVLAVGMLRRDNMPPSVSRRLRAISETAGPGAKVARSVLEAVK